MQDVRNQMRIGIPAEDAEAFRERVREAVQTVENICRAHGTTPQALPTPSRRAYTYLKELDLTQLPKPSGERIVPQGSVQVTGIVATVDYYHQVFSDFVRASPGPYRTDDAHIDNWCQDLSATTEAISRICEEDGGSPAALPIRSRRGYQWLSFLSQPERLAQHLDALSAFYQAGWRYVAKPELEVQIEFSSALYKTKVSGPLHRVSVHEGFIAAPKPILAALMRCALHRTDAAKAREQMKAYSLSPPFIELRAALEGETDPPVGSAKGQFHDLDAAFDRVNRAYFGGKAGRPQLLWSRRPSQRKLGHYDLTQDAVMVSMSLDAQDVPGYVIDYVIYHELLHRELGTTVVNGRRHAHTSAFREQERKFKDYQRAQAYLEARARAEHRHHRHR